MSAEITLLRTCRLRPDTASMGPRSDERGNALESADALGKMEQLQWGRAQMSAEISPRSVDTFRMSGCFNGAALR